MSGLGATVILAVVVVVAGAILWRRGDRVSAALAVVAVAGTYGLQVVTKAAVARPRPTWVDPATLGSDPLHIVGWDPASGAFPSGHVLQSVVVYGYLAAVVPARYRPSAMRWAAILVAAIGMSRVIVGAHWPTDVLGSWLMGGLVLAVLLVIRGRLRPSVAAPTSGGRAAGERPPARRRSTQRRRGSRGS
ncbi:MAG: phosphatase PAP2 family protein [Chloroflexi bacterium]|nr:phosphatase PAP2 family protein [Chloroflexota bacterium]